ncbi:MAG TPA: Sec-independent protein translocase protein TatB [Burkholderiales bacterium]|nr:Sec-independent protein translocase protein TatB [Burkholderiales bacterium]
MFDIGFSELLVIGVVALIVIGPERLPRVARTVGHLIGRLQRYVSDVKADINREVELEELRKMRDTVHEAAAGFESSVRSELSKTESELNAAATGAGAEAAAAAPEPPAALDPAATHAPHAAAPDPHKPAIPEKAA